MIVDESGRVSVNVVIVEDHRLVSAALSAALTDDPAIRVLAAAGSVAEALQVVDHVSADVILMDYRLPDGDGISAGRAILAKQPRVRIIMVTASQSDNVFSDILRAGFTGCISKGDELEHLSDAIFAAHAGRTAWSPDLLHRAVQHRAQRLAGSDLTLRERDVLTLLAEGYSGADMTASLQVTANTLRNHIQNAMEKLNCHTRLEAVVAAQRLGLVKVGETE